jgi:hypothetical protein
LFPDQHAKASQKSYFTPNKNAVLANALLDTASSKSLKHELTVEELLKADAQTRMDVELAEKVGEFAVRVRRKSL